MKKLFAALTALTLVLGTVALATPANAAQASSFADPNQGANS